MKNSEYIKDCRNNGIEEPNVMGFYFPTPIPYPQELEEDREPIYTCCYSCAEHYYFELDPAEIEEERSFDPEYAEHLIEEHKALRLSKETLDSAVMISFISADQILEVFPDGFACYMCDSVSGYF